VFRRTLLRLALTLSVGALVLGGCGGGDDQPDPQLRSAELTIWSSLPERGPLRELAADVLAAERLALVQEGGRIGHYQVRLVALDASSPGAGRSDPAQMSRNARAAANSPRTIAYLGELATGTSAISIPLLNQEGILQVSPFDTAIAYTTRSLAIAGSPERYYPKLRELGRTFARVVPSDRSQVDALLTDMAGRGVRRLAILTDEDPSGRALATDLRAKARAAGIAVVVREEIDEHAVRHEDAIARVQEATPDALLDATGPRPGAAPLWRELNAADPQLQLYAPASLADTSFVAGLGPAASVAHVTRPILAEGEDTRAAWRFARAFARRYGRAPAPEARYGYEAMRSVLGAIRRAEAEDDEGLITRRAVVRAYFRTVSRDGVLGPYAIDAAGDTSLDDWAAYRVVDGALSYAGTLSGGAGGDRSSER
jgi:branched-chain amino acid transport system substrate-binding protein